MSLKHGLLVFVLVALALATCGGDDGSGKGGTKEFYDSAISLNLPGGWEAEARDIGRSNGRIMLYSSPKVREAKSANDLSDDAVFGSILFGPLYDFELEDGPEGTLRSYLSVEGGLPVGAEFHALEINGNPASRFTTIEEQDGLEIYSYYVSIFFDDTMRVYVLLYGFEGNFDTVFEALINSLQVDTAKLATQFDA